MTDELTRQPISWLSREYDERRLSPVELVEAMLARIEQIDGELHSFLEVTAESAREEARRSEAELMAGRRRGPLEGIPVALKDLIDMAGVRTTGGSAARRAAEVAQADAQMVATLRAGGAIVLGKNSLYELGMGLPMPGEWPTPARNPWDLERIPGGSSSGSAAAVQAGLCSGSYGTDTGGSIRGPAAYCGVVGLKPTTDLISRAGVLALSWTLDHVGPIGRTVADAAALLAGAAGMAPLTLADSIGGLRVGLPETLIAGVEIEEDVERGFWSAVEALERLGAKRVPLELPNNDLTEAALMTIIGSEGLASHMPALADHPELFGRSARERLSAGLALTGADYVNALRLCDQVVAQMAELYDSVDVIASPVVLQVAPRKADFERNPPHRTPFTGIHNLTGGPAVTLPCALDRAGMPIGIQIAGPVRRDDLVMGVASVLERELDWQAAA